MDKKIYKKFVDCVKAMRKDPKCNWVVGFSSNSEHHAVCYLDVFRKGINCYSIKFNSPLKGCSWKHDNVELKHVIAAIETWFYDLKNIDKYKYMEY